MSRHSSVFTIGLLPGLGLLCFTIGLSATTSRHEVRGAPFGWQAPSSWQAPSAAAASPNPYAGQTDAIRAGGKLYRRHCAECHGSDAEGRHKAPSLRSPSVQEAPPGILFWFLSNGNLKQGMPSWSRLPEERRWQLVSYLESLGTAAPSTRIEPSAVQPR